MISYKGCIDNFIIEGSRTFVCGWILVCDGIDHHTPDSYAIEQFHPQATHEVSCQYTIRRDLKHITDIPVGFRFELPQGMSREQFLYGKCMLKAEYRGNTHYLYLWQVLEERLKVVEMDRLCKRFAEEQSRVAGQSIADDQKFSGIVIPAGTYSTSRDSIVGQDGYAYLLTGTNDVQGLYELDRDEWSGRWIDALPRRYDKLTRRGCEFVQVVVPEKQSVVEKQYPFHNQTPNRMLRAIEEVFANSASCPYYISVYDMLKNAPEGWPVYRKLDTHFTFFGYWLLFTSLLKHLKLATPLPPGRYSTRYMHGDLSLRFAEFPLYEPVSIPDDEAWELAKHQVRVITSFDPPNRAHVGKIRHLANDTAPCQKRVLVFGNSIFSTGDNLLSMTWFFARYFREVYFSWSPQVDYRLVDSFRPDIVVCQTVERFLQTVPEDAE